MNALRTIAEAGISATKGAVSPENQRAALLAVTEKGQELAKAAPGAASQASSRPSHQTMPTSFGPPPPLYSPRRVFQEKDLPRQGTKHTGGRGCLGMRGITCQDARLTDFRHRPPAGSLPTPEPLLAWPSAPWSASPSSSPRWQQPLPF